MATAKYHLRPIPHIHTGSPSLSPSTTASTGSDRSPASASAKRPFLPPAPPDPAPARRLMSPPTLRGALPVPMPHRLPLLTSPRADLELSPVNASAAAMPRRGGFPAPPTGHELMALFPPPLPNAAMGSTSGFFFEQERAFFARKGKEIVTVQIEVDMHAGPSYPHPHAPPPPPAEHPARLTSRSPRTHAGHALAPPPQAAPPPPPQAGARAPRGGIPIIPVQAQSAPVSAPSPQQNLYSTTPNMLPTRILRNASTTAGKRELVKRGAVPRARGWDLLTVVGLIVALLVAGAARTTFARIAHR